MNGDDMINEGGPDYLGPDDVVDPPFMFEIMYDENDTPYLVVKREDKVVYTRALRPEEISLVVNVNYDWLSLSDSDPFVKPRDLGPNS